MQRKRAKRKGDDEEKGDKGRKWETDDERGSERQMIKGGNGRQMMKEEMRDR